MLAVGFCSYWSLAVAAPAGSTAAAVAVSDGSFTQPWDCHLYTAMAMCRDSANCFATSDPRKDRFAGQTPCV